MTARRVSACGLTKCQNARLKVGIATGNRKMLLVVGLTKE
jgi:hypothetical protein